MESEELDMELNLHCPHCGFEAYISVPDDSTPEDIKMIKACPCGGVMETMQEKAERMKRSSIKTISFYTMIAKTDTDTGTSRVHAVKKEGIEFKRCGITLYAYQRECNFPVCYIIDPETGLSIDTVNYPLSVVHRHISRNAINALKQAKADRNNEKYQQQKKAFKEAKRVEVIED